MKILLELTYVTIAVANILITYLFFISKNGALRRALITFFLALSFSSSARVVFLLFDISNLYVIFICIVPTAIGSVVLLRHIFKNIKQQRKEYGIQFNSPKNLRQR